MISSGSRLLFGLPYANKHVRFVKHTAVWQNYSEVLFIALFLLPFVKMQ